MIASELIAILSALPPTTRIVVDGHEGGFDDVIYVDAVGIRTNANTSASYYGRHIFDKVAPTEGAAWIRSRNARGNSIDVQLFEKFVKAGVW